MRRVVRAAAVAKHRLKFLYTAESHLRNILQALQGLLELTEAGDLLLPRASLERWQALLVLAFAALAEPPASSPPLAPSPPFPVPR